MLYFQYKSLPDEVLEYVSLWEQFSILPDKAYSRLCSRCKIPGYPNDTWAIQSEYHEQLINVTIPASKDPSLLYDKCHIRRYNNGSDDFNVVKCTQWVYDTETFKETFVSKVC